MKDAILYLHKAVSQYAAVFLEGSVEMLWSRASATDFVCVLDMYVKCPQDHDTKKK